MCSPSPQPVARFSLAASRTCGPWRQRARPRAALRLRRWETPVDDHDGDPLVHVSWHSWVTQCPSVPSRSAPPPSRHRTPAAQASLTSFHPPYACGASTATPFPRSAACRASVCHCCCPAVSASSAKTSAPISRTQSQRQPCTPKIATTRETPAAQQRQRIKGAFADPERTSAGLQRCGVEIPLRASKVIMPLGLGDLLFCAYHTPVEVRPAVRPASYAERPRGRRANRGLDVARCPAPHSPHHAAAPGPGAYRAAAGTLRRGSRAEQPGRQRATRPGRARRDLAVLSGLSLVCVLLRLCVSPVTVGIARPPRSCPTPVRTPPDRCQRRHAASPAEPR